MLSETSITLYIIAENTKVYWTVLLSGFWRVLTGLYRSWEVLMHLDRSLLVSSGVSRTWQASTCQGGSHWIFAGHSGSLQIVTGLGRSWQFWGCLGGSHKVWGFYWGLCSSLQVLAGLRSQDGIKYFTSWELILSAKNFARNSVSQTRQKTSKIALNWEFLPMTRNF